MSFLLQGSEEQVAGRKGKSDNKGTKERKQQTSRSEEIPWNLPATVPAETLTESDGIVLASSPAYLDKHSVL